MKKSRIERLETLLQEAREELSNELEAIGGCDHSVGCCCCSLIRLVEAIDNELRPEWKTQTDAFPYTLRPGDQVTWVDPDMGLDTRTDRISAIEFYDNIVCLTWHNGDRLECFAHELKQPCPSATI